VNTTTCCCAGSELNLADKIKCNDCRRISLISELIAVPGHTIPKIDKRKGYMQQILYYCPCNKKMVRAYDPGDGRIMLTNPAHASKVPFPSSCEL